MKLHKWEKVENGYITGKRVVVEIEKKSKVYNLRISNEKMFRYPIANSVEEIKNIMVDANTPIGKNYEVKEYGIITNFYIEDEDVLTIITVVIESYYRNIEDRPCE